MNLLLRRQHDGIGDWLLMLQAMKFINRQRPALELYVDFRLPPARRLPPIVREAYRASDVVFVEAAPGTRCDRELRHLVYDFNSGEPYLAGMVRVLRQLIGGELELEPAVYPEFRFPRPGAAGHVALVSQGKRLIPNKEWPHFEALVLELDRRGVPVVQLGVSGDAQLCEDARFDAPFAMVAETLAGARAFVGLENGLSVLAGFLGVPQVVVCGREWPAGRLRYPNLITLPGARVADVLGALGC